nr:carbon-nitrogen hydrolase family protein [Sinirhodobacter sp. WL0062]
MRQVTIAAAAYPLDWLEDWSAYEAKARAWVEHAVGQGAVILVFPEYAAMELASLGGPVVAGDIETALHEVARHRPAMEQMFAGFAQQYEVYILAPSGPVIEGDKRLNRAAFFGPAGRIGHQDKVMMTRFEREVWDVSAGQGLQLFDTALGKIGVVICYDSEFPLLARALCEAGAETLLVPSCTDAVAGWSRVRVGSMARALENQCVVVQAPTVGDAHWCPAIDENRGAAAIFGPPDAGWPETGVIAQGELDTPGWVIGCVDLDLVAQSRADGRVLPFAHWPEQLSQVKDVTITRETPAET